MRITLLEDYADRKAGDTFDLTNDEKAKRLVTAGIAKAAPAPVTPLFDDAALASFRSMGQEIAKGIAVETNGQTKAKRPDIRVDSIAEDFDGLKIFGSHGGFFHAVKNGCAANPERDSLEKIEAWGEMQKKCGVDDAKGFGTKAPSGNFEANDPDGGVLVIPEFSQKIVERMIVEENFLQDTDITVVRGNMMQFPALDDKSRADGARSGGMLGAYADEAAQLANVSKVQFRPMDLKLKKLYIFAYMTDELLADSPYALETYLSKKAAAELTFKINDGLIRGNGGGQPKGALTAGCKIAVAKESGQAGLTILNANIEKMWMRLNAACRSNAVWLINQDTEQQLQSMALPIGVSGVPTYMPVGGVSNPSFATLKGRPVKPVEFCETLGTEGDIILIDWSKYLAIVKGGVKTDMSMHVRFQFGEMAYRFTYRFDAQPAWDAPLTPYKGTNTTSPIITLAVRA